MKRTLTSIVKVILPLVLGFFFIWIVARKLTRQNIIDIEQAFKNANYWWILLSLVLAALSHLSRAWRWKYMLERLDIKNSYINSIMTVFIGYFVNLAVPRLGDVTRCGLFARYEKANFSKVLGTVIAERVADIFMLLCLIIVDLFFEFDRLKGLLMKSPLIQELSGFFIYLILACIILIFVVFIILIKKSKLSFFRKIRIFLRQLFEGLKTIVTMKKKGLYIAHTVFIWLMYYGMVYCSIFALPQTSHLTVIAVLSAFVIGSISIAATNGGIGSYPLGIREILILYGVNAIIGYAFGWILWTAQTAMIVIFGSLSLIFIPIVNKPSKKATAD